MEKSYIEKIIKQKAEERFNSEWRKAVELVANNPILRRVSVKIPDTEGGLPTEVFLFESGGAHRMILSEKSDKIDYEKIRGTMLSIYEKEETETLLNKLDAIRYLFQDM